MAALKNIADDRTLQWLLEKDNPSVRYFTLTGLLGKPDTDADVISAKHDIMLTGAVPALLSGQAEGGYWGDPDKLYHDKYSGTVWRLLMLAELGADPADGRVRQACEFIFANSQDTESFGFAMNRSAKAGGGRHSEVIPCLTGNMVFSLIRLGYLKDIRVQKAIGWICDYQRADDGITAPPSGWPYDRLEACFGRHTCHMGAVKALKALAAIPEGERSGAVNAKLGELMEYLLIHHIYKKSHELSSISRPGWLKFGFPLMYQTDALEILGMLAALGCRDSRMDEAIEAVTAKQGKNGRWKLENTFNGKTPIDIESKGEDSKWITLKALKALMGLT